MEVNTLRGAFDTHYPCRANPIDPSIILLLAWCERLLDIEGVDVFDGMSLLDIKT